MQFQHRSSCLLPTRRAASPGQDKAIEAVTERKQHLADDSTKAPGWRITFNANDLKVAFPVGSRYGLPQFSSSSTPCCKTLASPTFFGAIVLYIVPPAGIL
ncbi:hypothetical protein J3459_007779 [Metarhizium acridum]|nr:hypothetical protein J3459_007779 [Metarhizium acridum]